jgi:hypothetical protein
VNNNAMMMMYGLGGSVDPSELQGMVTRTNGKRRELFEKIADILFGIIMFFYGGLTFKDKNNNVIDVTNSTTLSTLSTDDKLGMILGAQVTTTKGTLFRELLRPLFVSLAGIIATLLEPDEGTMHMVSSRAKQGLPPGVPGVPGFPGLNLPGMPSATPSNPAASAPAPQMGSPYEGKTVQASPDPHIWLIQGGYKHWVLTPAIANRYGQPTQVSQNVIDGYPTGNSISQ